MTNRSLEALEELKNMVDTYSIHERLEFVENTKAKKVKNLYNTIKQDLERKEQLEKENQDLKIFVDSYANARDELLIRKQYLEKENQELKEEIQDLKDNETIVADYGVDLWNENEKLKNAIKILKEKVSFKVILNLCDEEEKELLNEVLNNDKTRRKVNRVGV